MEQYLNLLREIKERGTHKPAARENMPGTLSLFGYQFRHNLSTGFPLLTTKKMFWKGVVCELLWFLRGDTNIKFLVDNGCHFWDEDAYNYYRKVHKQQNIDAAFTFDEFVNYIKVADCKKETIPGYCFGDCGYQYGKLWRDWDGKFKKRMEGTKETLTEVFYRERIDQISDLIQGLKSSPMSRRHIITAWNPATLDQMALHPCHVLVQFNCRPLTRKERLNIYWKDKTRPGIDFTGSVQDVEDQISQYGIPKYYLDCQLYQRSADVVLGVPFNIASYALLTHILAKICNMIPGEFIHSFGDVHIYTDHLPAVEEQLTRKPRALPKLKFTELVRWNCIDDEGKPFDPVELFKPGVLGEWEFELEDYNPHPKLKNETKLSTGLK